MAPDIPNCLIRKVSSHLISVQLCPASALLQQPPRAPHPYSLTHAGFQASLTERKSP